MAVAAKIWDVQINVHLQGNAKMECGMGSKNIDLLYGGGNGERAGTQHYVLIPKPRMHETQGTESEKPCSDERTGKETPLAGAEKEEEKQVKVKGSINYFDIGGDKPL